MLYANGLGGVARLPNGDAFRLWRGLGRRCRGGHRIAHLQRLSANHDTTSKFDWCDDATSGFTDGECEVIQ
jgi:hypothetical protein